MTSTTVHVPPSLRRGALKTDREQYIDSGAHLLSRIPQWLGLRDLSDASVLDVGCGTKFTQAILRDDIPIKRYAYPGKPLHWALYARDYAIELADNTGWHIESINDPEEHVQHFIICALEE